MDGKLRQFIEENGTIPLAWAGSTSKMDYLNLGDALSPVMVALCSGLPVQRIPSKSLTPRIAAVGTIGHGMEGGSVSFWGTGSSKFRNPGAAEPALYHPPANTQMHIHSTRGPVSRALLSGAPAPADAVFGDPVWLLPEFYRPKIEKKWELGVILHLSELSDRGFQAAPLPQYSRYEIPEGLRDDIHLINTVTPISVEGIRERLDEILACKRIVSTSLHGMVFAESYGIPCLYFAPDFNNQAGLAHYSLGSGMPLDSRIVDLYSGLKVEKLPIYVQPRRVRTDWRNLLDAIDETWRPVDFDGDALMNSFPLGANPVQRPEQGSIFDVPLLKSIKFQHAVDDLQRADKARGARWAE